MTSTDTPGAPDESEAPREVQAPDEPSPVARGKASIARAKARVGELRRQAEDRRSRSAFVDVGFIALEHDGQVGGGVLAGAVAFRIFLFVVPFVFVLVAGFGLVSDAANKSARSWLPTPASRGCWPRPSRRVDGQTFGTKLTIILLGGFAFIVGARTLVLVLNAVHVLVWRLPRTPLRRPGPSHRRPDPRRPVRVAAGPGVVVARETRRSSGPPRLGAGRLRRDRRLDLRRR